MDIHALSALRRTLSSHVDLGKTRLETLCLLVLGMISARTVNLSHLAAERPGHALIASTYRRLQRFFQHVSLADDWAVALVTALLGHTGPWYLCLDRTNWKVGRRDINILMLSVATKRYRVPLMWSVLDKAGNSNTAERIALMERYLSHFDASTVRMLLADREFIGQEWLNFLVRHGIAFTIRVKENQIVETGDGRRVELRALLRTFRGSRSFQARFAARCGHPALELHFAAKRLDTGELLITASTQAGTRALNIYRKRWTIECLFADTKTRGLNLEDTRLTSKRKLHLLLAIVAIAVAWICRTASLVMGRNAPPRKTHGYYAKSWFRIGFDELRRRLRHDPQRALIPIAKAAPRLGVV